MMRVRAFTVALLMVFLTAPTLLADAPSDTITVKGRLINGTDGGDPVEGLSVTLHQNTTDRLNESQAKAGQDGSFVFENVIYGPDIAYGVSVVYKGALYGINLDLSAGDSPPFELAIYEPLHDDEILRAALVSILISVIDPATETLSILGIVRLVNESDLAYVPGPEPMQIIRFALPEGARDLQVDTSLLVADIFQVDRGFGVSASVPPGAHEVLFSYKFPYSGASHEIAQNLRYGADLLRVVIPSAIAGLASPSIGTAGKTEIGEQPYNVLEVKDVPKGHQLNFTLTNLAVPTFGDRALNTFKSLRWEFTAPVALAVLVIAAAIFVILRNRRLDRITSSTNQIDERLLILEMITDLDKIRREGGINEDRYRTRRSALTGRLAQLSKSPKP